MSILLEEDDIITQSELEEQEAPVSIQFHQRKYHPRSFSSFWIMAAWVTVIGLGLLILQIFQPNLPQDSIQMDPNEVYELHRVYRGDETASGIIVSSPEQVRLRFSN